LHQNWHSLLEKTKLYLPHPLHYILAFFRHNVEKLCEGRKNAKIPAIPLIVDHSIGGAISFFPRTFFRIFSLNREWPHLCRLKADFALNAV